MIDLYYTSFLSGEIPYVHRYHDGPNEPYDLVNDDGDRNNPVDDPAQVDRIKDLKIQMKGWFTAYVIADKNGCEYHVTGAGQLHPIGRKWEDWIDK